MKVLPTNHLARIASVGEGVKTEVRGGGGHQYGGNLERARGGAEEFSLRCSGKIRGTIGLGLISPVEVDSFGYFLGRSARRPIPVI